MVFLTNNVKECHHLNSHKGVDNDDMSLFLSMPAVVASVMKARAKKCKHFAALTVRPPIWR